MRHLAFPSIRAIDQAQQDGENPLAAQEERDEFERIRVANNPNK